MKLWQSKNGKWEIHTWNSKSPNSLWVTDGYCGNEAFRYDDGRIAYTNVNLPLYVKKQIARIFKKRLEE